MLGPFELQPDFHDRLNKDICLSNNVPAAFKNMLSALLNNTFPSFPLMIECLTTPQLEKQIAYWMSEPL